MAAAVVFCALPSIAALGQSAVITLVFPYGARSYAMGEVGTALVDDESVLYFNPAGLDVPNDRWRGGAATYFYEPLLSDSLRYLGITHHAVAVTFRNPYVTWGQFGFFINHINMGVNEWTDELGRVLGKADSYETVVGLGWGFDFKEVGIENHYFGITAKWFRSALAPGFMGAGAANSIAFDLGYIWTIGKGFRLGAALMNMGPAVYYIDESEKDPIPFTLNCAVAYTNEFLIQDLRFCSVAAELRLDREVVKNYADKSPDPFYAALWTDLLHDNDESFKSEMHLINEHLGCEVTLLNTLSLRSGFLIDPLGERFERHWGIGIRIFDHFSFDYGNIYSPPRFMRGFSKMFDPANTGSWGFRHNQYQISFAAERFLDWSEDDKYWWKKRK
jgi:hypothetical protein